LRLTGVVDDIEADDEVCKIHELRKQTTANPVRKCVHQYTTQEF